MKIKNLKIRTQLWIAFALTQLLVIVMGVVSYRQSNQIHLQTEMLYEHPFQVRRALDRLELDILNINIGIKDISLAKNPQQKQEAIQLIAISEADIHLQFELLKEKYLGPPADIDNALKAFISWDAFRVENTRLTLLGVDENVIESKQSSGIVEKYREQMMAKIKLIDNFAEMKSDELFSDSKKLSNNLNLQLILIIFVMLLFTLIINYFLSHNIRMPIEELIEATRRFQKGDLNARSTNTSQNEFGRLSASFNILVEDIQIKTEADEKFKALAALMLSEYDIKKFFQATLNAIAVHTDSQMAAIYLLSDDKKTFNHFESIGIDENARQSFAADNFEGEFGTVLSSRKVQHIKNIPPDTRFVFNTVSGKFTPNEFITLPIIVNNEVVAIISLASIKTYNKQAVQLIDNILLTLCTRVEGILAFHRLDENLKKIESQNIELETQKTELASQSAELSEQNTELEIQKNQLSEVSKLKTNFLSNMSHELRTPLNSVIALSGVLNRRLAQQIPDEEYSYLEVIERNGKHLLSLINDILDISRIEAGREDFEITRFNIGNLIAEVVGMIQPQAKQKNIQLLHSSPDTEIFIASDADKCHHILQNLISNAVKFTEKGKVDVIATLSDNSLSIIVKDSGIGISQENISHIFDEFRQADGSTSRRFGGSGLGLAIAQKYAHLLGGHIIVKSSIDKGSEFTLTLPARYAAENRILEDATINPLNYPKNKTIQKPVSEISVKSILLVEDSEPSIIQIKDFLEESGYQILVARDGNEALSIIARTIPDAMILDLMMPDIDGFEVLETIRNAERTALIPVLILTAKHITKEELCFLKRNNIHQLIQKGDINRDELLNAVTSIAFPHSNGYIPVEVINKRPVEGKAVVLVVEDNPDNMITVKALLGDNYSVIEAVNGIEGIALANVNIPHLILMDIALPEKDGIEAFKIIRSNEQLQHIPIIALTASAMTSDRETILAYGFDAYIPKPIEDKLFFKTINQVLYGT